MIWHRSNDSIRFTLMRDVCDQVDKPTKIPQVEVTAKLYNFEQ